MTLVLLLALLASIVDIARWHAAVSQSTRTLHLANQSVLSHYNDYTKEEYGIFAIDTMEVDIAGVLVPYLSTSQMVAGMDLTGIVKGPSLASPQGLDYYDGNIQTFMKLRAPMLLIDPLLEKLDMLQKSGKTVKMMEKQQEVFGAGSDIDADYKVFRDYIDGRVNSFNPSQLADVLGQFHGGAVGYWDLTQEKKALEDRLDQLKDRKSDLYRDLSHVIGTDEAADNARASIKRKISSVKSSISRTKSNISRVVDEMARIKDFYNDTVPRAMERLTGDGSLESLLEANKDALNRLETLMAETKAFRQKVEQFKAESEAEKASYIEESYLGAMSQTDDMLVALGAGGTQLTETGNLLLFKEKLEKNIALLERLEDDFDEVVASAKAIGRTGFSGKTDAMVRDNRYEVVAYNINRALSQYRRDFSFEDATGSDNVAPGVKNKVDEGKEGLESSFDIGAMLEELGIKGLVMPDDKPSSRLEVSSGEEAVSDKGLLDALMLGGGLPDMAGAAKAYRNEYAVGMFSMIHELSTEEKELTLAGFDKSKHPFSGEVEYIITGLDNNLQAVAAFCSILLATRTALNAASLVASPTQRSYIMGVAQAIAGWWTAGIGAVALAVVIGALWALLEAFVDLVLLVRGYEVPLIKTDRTWYTSLDGSCQSLMNQGLDEGKKVLSDAVDKSAEAIKFFISEGTDKARAASASFRTKIESALDQTLSSVLDPLVPMPSVGDYFEEGTPEYAFAEEMLGKAKSTMGSGSDSLESLIKARNSVLDAYEKPIGEAMDRIEKEVTDKVDSIVEELKENFNLDIARKKLSAGDSSKKTGFAMSDFVPKFNYKDYCRAMLFFGVDENKTLVRMMDLMEYNLRDSSGCQELSLSKHVFSLESKARVSFNPLFPVLPFESRVFKGMTSRNVGAADGY